MRIIHVERQGDSYIARAGAGSEITANYVVDKLLQAAPKWYAANKNTTKGLEVRSIAASRAMKLTCLLVDLKLAQVAATIQHRYLETGQRTDLQKLPNTKLAKLCDTSESTVRRRILANLYLNVGGRLIPLRELTQRDNKAAREHDAYNALVELGYEPGGRNISVRAIREHLLTKNIDWKPRALADAVTVAKEQLAFEYEVEKFSDPSYSCFTTDKVAACF